MSKFKILENQLRELTATPSLFDFEEPMIKYIYEKQRHTGLKQRLIHWEIS
jgi:hypothetical protein